MTAQNRIPAARTGDAESGRAIGRVTVALPRSPSIRSAELDELATFDSDAYADDVGLPDDARRARVMGHLAWALPTLLMGALGAVGVTVPGMWADELATWGIASLTWSDTWQLLGHTDAAIAPYHVVMHVWIVVFGDSDLAMRLPSVLAMTAAAGLIGRLGTRIAAPRLGLMAGLIFACAPVTSRYAQEARPYAIAVLMAVAATLLLVRFIDEDRMGRLAAYAAAVAVLGLFHVLALALLVAHAFVVLALRPRLTRRWIAGAAVGAAPSAPLLWLGHQQRVKIAWIADSDASSPLVFVGQFFGTPLVAAALVCLGLLGLSARRPSVVFSAWALLPAGVLLGISQLAGSVWLPRYLLFALPAWALLAGFTLARVPLPAAAVTLVALVAFALPRHEAVRTPEGHDLASRQVADIIARDARPGDAIIYGSDNPGARWVPRDVVARYVPADRRPADVLLARAQRTGGAEFAVESSDVAGRLGDTKRVWLVRVGAHPDPLHNLGDAHERSIRERYVVDRVWQPTGMTVALLVNPRT